MEEVAVEAVEDLTDELGIVLFAQEEGEYGLEEFWVRRDILSVRVQHYAYWQMLAMRASISMMVSSSVMPLIMSFSMKSMNFSLTSRMSVQSLPSFDPAMIPNI